MIAKSSGSTTCSPSWRASTPRTQRLHDAAWHGTQTAYGGLEALAGSVTWRPSVDARI